MAVQPPYAIGSTTWPGLSKLIEEMGELSQVLGKIVGCGGLDHWDGDLTDSLYDELADVDAALEFFRKANDLDPMRHKTRRLTKFKTFVDWHRRV